MDLIELLRTDPTRRAAWFDRATPGLFARFADVDDAAFLEEHLGPIGASWLDPAAPPPGVPRMNSSAEAIEPCRRIAASFRTIADARGPVSDADYQREFKEQARLIGSLLAGHILAAGEVSLTLGQDLNLQGDPLTMRAHLVMEMVAAIRDEWRWSSCDYCGAWHRIRRAPGRSRSARGGASWPATGQPASGRRGDGQRLSTGARAGGRRSGALPTATGATRALARRWCSDRG